VPDDPPKRRAQTQTGRDEDGMRARKERDALHAIPPIRDKNHTPVEGVGIVTLEDVDKRSREIKNTTSAIASTASTTLNGIEELRREYREDHRELHGKVDALGEKLVGVETNLGRELAFQNGQNKLIIDGLDDLRASRRNTEHVITTHRVAEIEVDKTRQIADVEVSKARALDPLDAAKAKREWVTKVLAIVASGTAIVLALIEASRC
jgi:hypothetical protein